MKKKTKTKKGRKRARSKKSQISAQTCAICLGSMKSGDGKALFTAECSHVFHFNCIASSVQQGNRMCPVCHSTWTNLPSQSTHQLLEFADDEPLPARAQDPTLDPVPSQVEGITVKALPEYPALSQSAESDSFAVLVGIQGPSLSPEAIDRPGSRAPIDLVAVLDVSGSMQGNKIRLLKQAVNFVVDNMSPADRFSIITFSNDAERVTPLKRMTGNGRAETTLAVKSLRADGWTNIIAGLWKAVRVLEQRREKNPVASIILLSDGQDNQNPPLGEGFYTALNQLPACIRSRDMGNSLNQTLNNVVPVPVHTFGFGFNHDARALHAVADGSGGTFSYVETIEVIQDAFAQCLGGLLSVVANDVKIQVQASSVEVGIQSISSGRYQNTVESNIRPQQGLIEIGDLYAEEEKRFLIYLSVPQEMGSSTTKLLEVKCSHKNPLTNDNIETETETKIVEIRRCPSEDIIEADRQVCLEVDRERNQVLIAEAIAQAQVMAERGEFADACSLLDQRRQTLLSSYSARAGDSICEWLDSEVSEIREQMKSRTRYSGGGRAYALSTKCSLMCQRASTRAGPRIRLRTGAAPPGCKVGLTHCMKRMVRKSQMHRESIKKNEENSSKQ